jgi:hypothetical protein
VGLVPEIDKEIIEIDGSFAEVGGFALTAGGAWSTTTSLEQTGEPIGQLWPARRLFVFEKDKRLAPRLLAHPRCPTVEIGCRVVGAAKP